MSAIRQHIYVISLVGVAVIAALSLMGAGSLTEVALEKYHLWRMSKNASEGQLELEVQLAQVTNEVDSLRQVVENLSSRTYPDLQSLKKLAGDHRLRIRKIERVSGANTESSGEQQYSATLEGSVGRLVSFLKDLEDTHIVVAPQVSLYSIDAEGKTIAMYLVLTVRSS